MMMDEMSQTPEPIEFDVVIQSLLDEQAPFPASFWNSFSDVNEIELQQLKEFWEEISEKRKTTLLQDLAGMMDYNFQVCFDDFAKFCILDDVPGVREAAIRLLYEYDRRDLIPVMLDILENDADDMVQAAAGTMLGNYVYLGELEELPRKDKTLIEETLLHMIEESNSVLVQRRCLEALSFSSRDEVAPLILAAYETGERDWIASALFAMGRSANPQWTPYVHRNLEHDDSDIQFEAIQAAGRMYLENSLPLLITLTEDVNSLSQPIRMALAEALKNIGGEEGIQALHLLLKAAEDDEELDMIGSAIEYAAFTNTLKVPDMFGFDGEELGKAINDVNGHSPPHNHSDSE
ncbi:MAG: HEAT repeat domain-containing protein [Anaerolineaceae bacterium]|nr:HEAT repeat domain-containing protein [Anaerolineaceae bacterium]